MSLELQIIRFQEFCRLGPRGNPDLNSSKDALAVLAAACLKRGIHRALLDLRALQPGANPIFSSADLVSLVSTFKQVGFTSGHRLAVLYTVDPHERARMFASIARLRGWTVKAFDNFEQAVDWLSDSVEARSVAEPDLTVEKTQIPVRKAKAPSEVQERIQPIIRKKPLPGSKPALLRAAPQTTTQSAGARIRAHR